MKNIRFSKFHGFGNDYIVIEKPDIKQVSDLAEFTKQICHRNTGVGGDGIALIEKLDEVGADYSCRIINPDGSEAGFSGNGTRCAVAYLYHNKLWNKPDLILKTISGLKKYEFLRREGNAFWYLAELGKPTFESSLIPFLSDQALENVVDYKLEIENETWSVTVLNVGNPVCALFVEDFGFDWRRFGNAIENHKRFPERTNVVFIKIIDEKNIEIRIWERGAGETSSSGTCSIAAAVASIVNKKTGRKVSVHAVGGTTEALWREDNEMLITGRADLAFSGKWYQS